MPPLVHHADDEEEGARRNAVIHHLNECALHGFDIEREDAEHDETQVTDGREGDELFSVRLRSGDQGAIQNANYSQNREQHGILLRSHRKERQTEAHQSVCAHLQKHAGQNDASAGGGLNVRIRQPCVKWEQRHLDRECKSKQQKQPALSAHGNIECDQLVPVRRKYAVVHRIARHESERQQCHEHEQGSNERVNDELECCINAILASPYTDDEIHRNERELEKHVEEEEIVRREYARNTGLQNEQQRVIRLEMFLNVGPGR